MVDQPDYITGTYHSYFVEGLKRILSEHCEPGVFLLVLANALQSDALWDALHEPLQENFQQLMLAPKIDLLMLGVANEDIEILEQIEMVGIDAFHRNSLRRQGIWELAFNPFRLLRPQREAASADPSIYKPFNPDGFHFLGDFLQKERFWKGVVDGIALSIYYNKFPILAHHCILVPEPLRQSPQFLTQDVHELVWRMCMQESLAQSGVGVGFNSLGAGASVNHLHLQMFYREERLPVEALTWTHTEGLHDYPAHCQFFNSVESAWMRIEAHHRNDQSYNLLYRPSGCYVMWRPQGEVGHWPKWSMGMGWAELAGLFFPNSRLAFESLGEEELEAALRGSQR